MLYATLLALHIIFVVTWFAGLFYLPRLFVYHAEADDELGKNRFAVMERRLYRGILTPSSILALVFGLAIVYLNWTAYVQASWFWWKIGFVILLFGYQGMCGSMVRIFARDANKRSSVFYRIFNEVPLVLLVAIVFLAILKPI